jgi:hypothetical protein
LGAIPAAYVRIWSLRHAHWIYDVPPLSIVGLFAVLFVGVCWLGIFLFRPFMRARLGPDVGLNEIFGDFLQYFGVMYGLLLGLLAVATYQNHTDVEKAVSSEASSLAALYRDVTAYPEPQRTELKTLLKEYTRYVIEEAWSLKRQGLDPPGGVKRVADFQASLVLFEPQTKAQDDAVLAGGALLSKKRDEIVGHDTVFECEAGSTRKFSRGSLLSVVASHCLRFSSSCSDS